MPIPRVIPCLLLHGRKLVKSVRFRKPTYVGDPINTVRIFNEKEVDELVFLDIGATPGRSSPQLDLIGEIARECFMPFAYGGGLASLNDIQAVLGGGAEKVILNSALHDQPDLVRKAAQRFGSQSIVASVDVGKDMFGKRRVVTGCGRRKTKLDPVEFVRELEQAGAGEILLTSIDRDGTFLGYDLDLVRDVSSATGLPVVACGGAGTIDDVRRVIREAGAEAAAAGSLFVYQNSNRSVLINYPRRQKLDALFADPT